MGLTTARRRIPPTKPRLPTAPSLEGLGLWTADVGCLVGNAPRHNRPGMGRTPHRHDWPWRIPLAISYLIKSGKLSTTTRPPALA
jgi:hypothetical protein